MVNAARSTTALAGIAALATVVSLVGCTPTSTIVEGSEVTVAVAQPFTSLNPATSYGRTSTTNADVASLTGAAFAYYDDAYRLIDDTSFGSAVIVAEDPLTVRYTVAPSAKWSDGTPIDAADLLLAWAANSGALNTPDFDDTDYVDPDTGRYTDDFPSNVVYFDGAIGSGLELATQTPQLGDDGRTLFVHFDEFVPAWKTVLVPGIPAHVLQVNATGRDYEDAGSAKVDLVAAILESDTDTLAALSRAWNDDYNLAGGAGDQTPADGTLLLSAGPYAVTAIDETGVTLEANPQYRGDRQPTIATIRVRYSPDPLETAELLKRGDVDIVAASLSREVADTFTGVSGVTVVAGTESRIEHIDLQFADGRTGVFDDPRVRQAFLLVLPREQIVDEVVGADGDVLNSFMLRPGAEGYADAVAENGSDDYDRVDVNAAISLLEKAEQPAPTVCILYDPANERRAAEFKLIQESAALAGFNVTDCSSPDWQGLLGVAGSYDAAIFTWNTTRLGPGSVAAIYRSESPLTNFNRYNNAEVDALIDELLRTEDHAEIERLSAEIDTHLWADAYGAPLYAYPTLTTVRDTVVNVTRSPLVRGVFWNAWAWEPAPTE